MFRVNENFPLRATNGKLIYFWKIILSPIILSAKIFSFYFRNMKSCLRLNKTDQNESDLF